MPTLRYTTCILLVFILTACAFTRADELTSTPTPTPTRTIQTTTVPTLQRDAHPVATALPEATNVPSAIVCPAEADVPTTRYTITADMDYSKRALEVEQQVEYVNRAAQSMDQLVLIIRPNSLPDVFKLESVELASSQATYHLTGQRLGVELPEALNPDCSIIFSVSFRINIPDMDTDGVDAYKGYLGHSYRQTNLGHWLPTMAVRQGDDWLVHDEIPIGEQDVLDDANWDVTLNIPDASDKLKVAAPGNVETNKSRQWHYLLPNARDFSLSMSEDYTVSTTKTDNGVTVELYTFDDAMILTDGGAINSPAFALDVAGKALSMYSDLYGEYPYKRMVIVQGDFPDGMEFSGLVFVGGEYFRAFGGPTSYLMLITVHQLAHQRW
jgi:hypothetical protein